MMDKINIKDYCNEHPDFLYQNNWKGYEGDARAYLDTMRDGIPFGGSEDDDLLKPKTFRI